MMRKQRKVIGLVSFSGGLDDRPPDVTGAAAALSRRGFRVFCLPERLRQLLIVDGDDFMEITIAADISTDDSQKMSAADWEIVGALMDEVNDIVKPFGCVGADSFGLLEPDHVPFEDIDFGKRLLRYDEEAMAREIVERKKQLARFRDDTEFTRGERP
jgi:hypothetical protein